MKATGIVRRIDDLGRVVIPKEIRRTMRIREGDPLEIYTTREGEVIFKKYSLLGGLEDFAAQFCDALNRTSGFTAAVTDRDAVIAITGAGKRELLGNRPCVAFTAQQLPLLQHLLRFRHETVHIRLGKFLRGFSIPQGRSVRPVSSWHTTPLS